MKLNCKPGDLCRVIPTHSTKRAGTVDKIIKVTEIDGYAGGGSPAWSYEGPLYICQCGCGAEIKGIADSCLRPLQDWDGTDEMLRIVGPACSY